MLKIREVEHSIADLVKSCNGYCPCAVEHDEDTKCMCKEFRESDKPGLCHCGRFEKYEVPDFIEYHGQKVSTDDRVIIVDRPDRHKEYIMYMPGLDEIVVIDDSWSFNGDAKCPTFFPSILTEFGGNLNKRNHCFITKGKIQYLSDCSHKYKNSIRDIPPIRDWPDFV